MDAAAKPSHFESHEDWHQDSLQSVSRSARVVHHYNTLLNGFSAPLTPTQAKSLQTKPGVLAVHLSKMHHLHTTRVPAFLGLPAAVPSSLPSLESESDVIIGVLDGVWPEHPSFNDIGLGPVPGRWKGTCDTFSNFHPSLCNRKLIGARAFKSNKTSPGVFSVRDKDGHGTHTSTTAAGSSVSDASLFGFARGTARGMAPVARLAMYKVCWDTGCLEADILAGMDMAVRDGVDVLSISLGGVAVPYNLDVIAVASLAATLKGVFVSCSAGNGGPDPGSVTNVAPWITTVGASTMDRDFPAAVTLGNGVRISGVSLVTESLNHWTPVVRGGTDNKTDLASLRCLNGSVAQHYVGGKVVVCERGISARVAKGLAVKQAGGVGMILANNRTYGNDLEADAHVLPASAVSYRKGRRIRKYISRMGSHATAKVSSSTTVLGVRPSPKVAAFSSRGPNPVDSGVLKPDLIAPGVNVLAGWTGAVGPTDVASDERRVLFSMMSGTSMSCPVVAGLAALLKAAHPDWSPAAIKSALMTTAYKRSKIIPKPILDTATGSPADLYATGAGHPDFRKAMNPGLVYNLTGEDYAGFLCAGKYDLRFFHMNHRCEANKSYRVEDLNYPTFSIILPANATGGTKVVFRRRLTNVSQMAATYEVKTKAPDGIKMLVKPKKLHFSRKNHEKGYSVRFVVKKTRLSGRILDGSIKWIHGKHEVQSRAVFFWL